MIQLIIKGDTDQARTAANSRGVPVQIFSPWRELTHAQALDEYYTSIVSWYNEPNPDDRPPYPAGTLMFYCCL